MSNPTGWKPSMEKGKRRSGRGGRRCGWGDARPGLRGAAGLRDRLARPQRGLAAGAGRARPAKEYPASLLRPAVEGMPEMVGAARRVVRHFTRLSSWNWGIDTGFYRSAPAP